MTEQLPKTTQNMLDTIGHGETVKTLPAYAWPGGYQIIYLDSQNCVLCPDCANSEIKEFLEDPAEYLDKRDIPTAYQIFYEGPSMECDNNCGTMIESAYGDPDDDKDQSND